MNKKITFQPQIIERDDTAINQQIEKLVTASGKLKTLAVAWEKAFKEPFTYPIFRNFPNSLYEHLFIKHLQIEYIKHHPILSKNYGDGGLTYEAGIRDMGKNIPDYTEFAGLAIIAVKYVRDNIRENYLSQLFDNNFAIPETLKEAIAVTHTYATRNIRENLIFEITRQFSELINILNNMGDAIVPQRDLNCAISGCFSILPTKRKYEELNFRRGEDRFFIHNVKPGKTLTAEFNPIYHYLQNLTDEEVFDLYENLKNNK